MRNMTFFLLHIVYTQLYLLFFEYWILNSYIAGISLHYVSTFLFFRKTYEHNKIAKLWDVYTIIYGSIATNSNSTLQSVIDNSIFFQFPWNCQSTLCYFIQTWIYRQVITSAPPLFWYTDYIDNKRSVGIHVSRSWFRYTDVTFDEEWLVFRPQFKTPSCTRFFIKKQIWPSFLFCRKASRFFVLTTRTCIFEFRVTVQWFLEHHIRKHVLRPRFGSFGSSGFGKSTVYNVMFHLYY